MSMTTTTTQVDFKEPRGSLSATSSTSTQTEISIHDVDGHEIYRSTRDRRWSGNSVLSHPKRGDLIRTEYFFGPNRDPVLRLLQSANVAPHELQVTGKWASRSARFTVPHGREFEWSYAKEKRADGRKIKYIVLRALGDVRDGEKMQWDRRVAQLARCPETRTPGTSRCSAGNGGQLQIDRAALQTLEIDESVVVATLLVMLKREIDRRRIIQTAVITGGGGGG
ncbi:hypothetical protein N7492_004648 [Penicillium capsulatum]|uniref:Uncharacterized protein n=1 Tax=Penicillium capsulatum TaxID=69766 RepID=A0A9W9IAU7_9EURO|nr:hypothetical protein N7492_004648 [Penicillium capsulatum]